MDSESKVEIEMSQKETEQLHSGLSKVNGLERHQSIVNQLWETLNEEVGEDDG